MGSDVRMPMVGDVFLYLGRSAQHRTIIDVDHENARIKVKWAGERDPSWITFRSVAVWISAGTWVLDQDPRMIMPDGI